MKHHNKLVKIAVSSLIGASLFMPTAWGLGLGEIDSKAKLNETLTARINLLSAKEFQQEELTARIASYESYGKFGVTREAVHGQLKFEIQTNSDGSKYIQVTSNQAIREPFLNFLVELNWPQGRLLREYTILLDPPALSGSNQQVISVPSSNNQSSSSTPQQAQNTKPRENVTETTSEPTVEAATRPTADTNSRRQVSQPSEPRVQFTGENWRVGRGETLWSIATRVRPDGASVSQTLAALYRNNPNAFINNDIDRLKAGVTLKVPPSSQVQSVSSSISYQDLKNSDSNQAPLDVRKNVNETAATDNSSSGGRLTISSVTDSELTDTSGANVQEGADGDVSVGSQDELLQTVDSLRLENEQLKRELEAVKAQDATGVALEDETLSVIAGSAEAKDDADEALQALAAEAEQVIAEQTQDVASGDKAQDATADDVFVNPVNNAETTSSVEKSFWQQDGFWKWPLIIIAALLSLLGLGFFLKKRQGELEQDLFVDESANKDFDRRQPSFTEKPMVTPEVETNPLDEADILIARGKLDQVESLLNSVLENDPDNYYARVKLMEVYSSNQKIDELKGEYQKLGDKFDHDSELGLKVASLMQAHQEVQAVETDIQVTDELFLSEEEVFGSQEPQPMDLSEDMDEILDQAVEGVSQQDVEPETKQEAEQETEQETEVKAETVNADNSIDFTSNNLDELQVQSAVEEEPTDLLSDDEAHTKIELAKAYIAMGDDESAIEILKEVEKEGSSKQQEAAKDLLADL